MLCDLSFSIVPPPTSVTLQPDTKGMLFVGTPINLVCAVTVNRVVDTDIMVNFTFANLPTRVTTSSEAFNESYFQGRANFGHLLPSDGGVTYICTSYIVPVGRYPYVLPAAENITYTMEVKALEVKSEVAA